MYLTPLFLKLYWELGEDIVKRQANSQWGDGFLKLLSVDLMAEFPDIKGFSERNLKYIRQWYLFYSRDPSIGQRLVVQFAKQAVSQIQPPLIGQQAVAQLTEIPWGHNLKIISKCQTIEEALYYVQQTQQQARPQCTCTSGRRFLSMKNRSSIESNCSM